MKFRYKEKRYSKTISCGVIIGDVAAIVRRVFA